jgi:hypothetical protein
LKEVLPLNNLLNLQAGRAGQSEVLESMAMHERTVTRPVLEGIGNILPNQHGRYWLEPASESFAHELNVGHRVFFLPCVEITGAAHTTHDFVHDEQNTILVADFPHGFQIPGY